MSANSTPRGPANLGPCRTAPTRGNDLGQHARRCRETLAAEVPLAGWKRSINQDILKSSKTGTIARPMSYPTCGNPAGMGQLKEAAMRTETAIDRVRRELHRVLDHMRADLDRIEILMAALSAFRSPVPDYEPDFRNMPHLMLTAHELR